MSDNKSKMQVIADKVVEHNERGETKQAIAALLEAIALLSKAQQQVMADVSDVRISQMPIGVPIRVGSEADL